VTDCELDVLLAGRTSVVLTLAPTEGEGHGERVWFDRHDLATPVAWRGAMRRQLGHLGYEPPIYGQEDHDTIVRVMVQLSDAGGRAGRRRGRAE
jgi:hypothetical protein